MDQITIPSELLTYFLANPLRGQEVHQKQVVIGHRGRSVNKYMSLAHILTVCTFVLGMPFSVFATEQSVTQERSIRFNDPGNLIDQSHRQEIIQAAMGIPDRTDPVLWIDVISKNEVDVSTGVIRAPLDGGGRIFKLQKESGKWIYVKENFYRSWTS